jgi:hypothetical protein
MQRLTPIATLTRKAARIYVPEIDDVCDRMAMPDIHIYLMKPPQTWRRQSWVDGKVPAQQIASPRSPLVRLLIAPSHGPELHVEPRQPVAGGQPWLVSASGLFEDSPPPYAPCEIFLEFLESLPSTAVSAASKQFKDFVQTGLEVTAAGGARLEVRYDKTANRIIVNLIGGSSTGHGRIAVSDPVGRMSKIDLN